MLELFAGEASISRASLECGLRIAVPTDILGGPEFDLCCAAVEAEVLAWIKQGRIWLVMFGTPCTSWSLANSQGASSERKALGLACARATVRLLRACRLHGVRIMLENPWSSQLWRWRPLARELARAGAAVLRFDMCCYGAAWRKPTGLATNVGTLGTLARCCPGHSEHVVLQGTVRHPTLGTRWRTHFAAAYPPGLARAVGRGLCAAAPRSAWRNQGEPVLHPWWQRRLAAARGCAASGGVALPPLPASASLGWEGATGQWGGLPLDRELRILRGIRRGARLREAQEARCAASALQPRRAGLPAARGRRPLDARQVRPVPR